VRQEGHDFDDVHGAGCGGWVGRWIGRGFAHGKDEYKRRLDDGA
jgi:hypothetical protein